MVDVGYDKHLRVNKSKHFSNGQGVHINGIESFWSFTKRRLAKFNGVKKYFDLHLKEALSEVSPIFNRDYKISCCFL